MNEQLTFEQAIQRLEEVVNILESGKSTLDESMKLFNEGAKLAAFCSDALKNAEQTIVELTESKMEG